MGILLAFAPFIIFAVCDRLLGVTGALTAAALASAALLARDAIRTRRVPKVLEIGTFVLFGGLALYAGLAQPDWSIFAVRLNVDAGLLLIVLATIAMRCPFTLQYAREQAPREIWNRPEFIRINYVITAVWALAFAVMAAADAVLLYMPSLPPAIGIGATVVAIVGAIKFTNWYPDHAQARAPARATPPR